MARNSQISSIIFDCDGVLLDSNKIKEDAFAEIAYRYFGADASRFIRAFHQANGGLSRNEKFLAVMKNFVPLRSIDLDQLSNEFDGLTLKELERCRFAANLRIVLTKLRDLNLTLFVISGTPEPQLQRTLLSRGLSVYFDQILGSPTSKSDHIRSLLDGRFLSKKKDFIFVGDSGLDYQAAKKFKNCRFYWSTEFAEADTTAEKIMTLSEILEKINF